MVSLEQIRYFLEIVRCGSLNKAAARLFISQPSLSKQLRQMESRLGCELVRRNYNGVEPTPRGRLLYEQMCGVVDAFDRAVEQVRQFEGTRMLHIGGLENLITYFLPRFMQNFTANGRNRVEVDTCFSNEELVQGVESGKYDMALLSNAEPQPDVAVIPLMTEPLCVVFPACHPLSRREEIDFLELMTRERLVLYKDPCTIRASIRRQCSRMKITPHIVMELDLTESLIHYVRHGDGITLLPAIVADDINDPAIAVRKIDRIPIYREISVAMKKEQIDVFLPMFAKDGPKAGM